MKCYFLSIHLVLSTLFQGTSTNLITPHQLLETLLPPRGQEFLGYLYLKQFSAWQQLSHQEFFFSISLVRDLPFPLMRSPRHVKCCYFRALLATALSSTVSSPSDCQSYTSSSVCQTSLLFYLSVTCASTDFLLKIFPWPTSYSSCYIY